MIDAWSAKKNRSISAWLWRVVALCFAFQGFGVPVVSLADDVLDPQLVSLYNEMKANIDHFSSYKCLFRYGQYLSESVEKARRDPIPDNLLFLQSYELYNQGEDFCIKPEGGLEYAKKNAIGSFPYIMTASRGGVVIDFDSGMGNSVINTRSVSHPRTTFHPLNCAGSTDGNSPLNLLTHLRDGNAASLVASVEDETKDEKVCKRLTMEGQLAQVKVQFWLDPERGLLPVKCEQWNLETNKHDYTTYVTDFFSHDGHFYPKEAREICLGEKVLVYFMVVDLFDPTYVPT
ncbi:hypothetical protein [Planctomicrobium piriforme]|uniref:Uncharacterized protein n=1 Tax=Planctomicrobium piriforme TaxID=1576369 RepID=A0A1I3FBV5_9PLAN|nr:hypothetical protein [Planctomicrobium piriforme]SFI08634.1 hypothetical protein SAMN05421753_105167 [Planctomicrobium piriforme]